MRNSANCPVCLDRLDGDERIRTVADTAHFQERHGVGRMSGGRFALDDATAKEKKCERCECANGSLWTCLICGVVGWRMRDRHAVQHWAKRHCYCLEIGSGRVWDYSRSVCASVDSRKHGLVELTPVRKEECAGTSQVPVDGAQMAIPAGGSHEDDDLNSPRL